MTQDEIKERIKANLSCLVVNGYATPETMLMGGNNNMAVIAFSRVLSTGDANALYDELATHRIGTVDFDPVDTDNDKIRVGWTVQIPPKMGGELLLDLLAAKE